MPDKSRQQAVLEARIRELETEVEKLRAKSEGTPRPKTTTVQTLPASSNELTTLIFQTSPTISFSWEAANNTVRFSPHWKACLGYTETPDDNEDKDGTTFFKQYMIDHFHEIAHDCLRRCIVTGEPQQTPLQLIAADGRLVWYELRTQVIDRDDNDYTHRVMGTLTDIDDLKKQQLINENSADTERWLRMLLRGLLEDDSDEVINQTLAFIGTRMDLDCCTLSSFNSTSLSAHVSYFWERKPGTINIDKRDIDVNALPEILSTLKAGKPVLINDQARKQLNPILADRLNHHQHLSIAAIPLIFRGQMDAVLSLWSFNDERQFQSSDIDTVRIIGDAMARAIARKKLHNELILSEERYTYAMEASQDGLWDWDLTTNKIIFSKSYLDMLGHAPGDFPATADSVLNVFMNPDDVEQLQQTARDGLRSKDKVFISEFRMRHKDGHNIWVYCRAKFVDFNERGRAIRCVGTNVDITQFKETQAELNRAKLQAIAANQTKNEFLTRMSHEIRTPMNAIIGMAHLLKDTSLNQKQLGYLKHVDDSASNLLNIIDDILDFSELESGHLLLENTNLDLDTVYDKLSRQFEQRANDKGLELIFDIGAEVPRFIKGDGRRLQQILANLLDNAVKFTNNGEVTLRCRQLPSAESKRPPRKSIIEFSVIDTGIGITPDHMEHLFAPFTQADGSSSRRFGGTGLGLTICHHLVEQMGGQLLTHSKPGHGSCFTFMVSVDHSDLGEQPIHQQGRHYQGLRTLIVDDHPAALTVLRNTAKSLQLSVSTSTNATDAVALLVNQDRHQNAHYDLVLIDHNMPGIDGLEACRMIQQHPNLTHKPKILLISSDTREQLEAAQPSIPFDGLIHRPVTPSRIFDAIAITFGAALFDQGDEALSDEEQDNYLLNAQVLLAEDNLVNQKVATGILAKKGVIVTTANNGLEALQALEEKPADFFAAVLMDMEMPEMDGYQATQEVRAGDHAADIPIIAMTAHAMQGDRERCLQAGMDDYLTKPINPQQLYKTLANHIAQHCHH